MKARRCGCCEGLRFSVDMALFSVDMALTACV